MHRTLPRWLAWIGLWLATVMQPAHAESHETPLRQQARELTPESLGLSPMTYPHAVWGVYVELGGADSRETLLVLGDGSVRIQRRRGEGITEAGGHADVRAAAKRLLAVANSAADASSSAIVIPPVEPGETRIQLLTYRGIRVAPAQPELLRAAQEVLAAAKLVPR